MFAQKASYFTSNMIMIDLPHSTDAVFLWSLFADCASAILRFNQRHKIVILQPVIPFQIGAAKILCSPTGKLIFVPAPVLLLLFSVLAGRLPVACSFGFWVFPVSRFLLSSVASLAFAVKAICPAIILVKIRNRLVFMASIACFHDLLLACKPVRFSRLRRRHFVGKLMPFPEQAIFVLEARS